MAGSTLPTYTGLAPHCSNFAAAAATAAAAAGGGAGCPAAPSISCSQAQLKPDVRIMQSAPIVAWARAGSGSGGEVDEVEWQPPAGVNTYGRPARVQLSLESADPPAFTLGPELLPEQQLVVSERGRGLHPSLGRSGTPAYGVLN